MSKNDEIMIKIITTGEGQVGKTSFLYRYMTNSFSERTVNTIGVEFFGKLLKIEEVKCNAIIWDFGGQHQFRNFQDTYVKGANGAFFMFDLTREKTLIHIREWVTLIRKAGEIPLLLIGTKSDLKKRREVSDTTIKLLLDDYGFFAYVETSAKTGENINLGFELLVKKVLEVKD